MMLPTPEQLKKALALGETERNFIAESRAAAEKILCGDDGRLALIVGPCSIHDVDAALEYAEKLGALSHQVRETCFLVMRVNVEKPRTTVGWKGMLYDPYLDGSNALEEGLFRARTLFCALAQQKIPTATEFLDPLAALYYDDLVTWGFIGARTSCSQPHRQFASSLSFPVGFKNGLDGASELTIHSLLSAAHEHTFLYANDAGNLCAQSTSGNPWVHLVLRGSHFSPNYDRDSIDGACTKLKEMGLNPRLLIDCAHGNCQKDYEKQKEVFHSVLEEIARGAQVFGMMLESHLLAGNQSVSSESTLKVGVSITDPCLDWSSTEELILSAHAVMLSVENSSGIGVRSAYSS